MSSLEKLYTVDDIAKMTSLTTRTIRNYLKDGSLVGRKIGGQWRFTEADVMRFMNQENVIKTVEDEAVQGVYDFMNGVKGDRVVSLQSCNIIDLYTTPVEAREKMEQLCALVNQQEDGSAIKFYATITEQQEGVEVVKARFIIYGPPAFMVEVYTLLK